MPYLTKEESEDRIAEVRELLVEYCFDLLRRIQLKDRCV